MIVDIFNTNKKYDIIYADPPWQYKDTRKHDPANGGITYKTMSLEEIKALPVPQICNKDCALFLWATMPMLNEALQTIKAWGFKYTTCAFVWVKLNPKNDGIYSGLGNWTNGNAELCLFARKGKPIRVAKNVKQIVMEHRARHSEKPAEVRKRITDLLGDLPRIELFARQTAEGWDSWGDELSPN